MAEKDGQLKRLNVPGHWLGRKERRARGWSAPWMPSRKEQSREELVADFVGEERAPEVLASLRPEMHDAGELVQAWLGHLDLSEQTLLHQIQEHWGELVGLENKKICHPLQISGSDLYIEVENAVYRFTLESQKQLFAKKISDFTTGSIKRIILKNRGTNRRY